MGERQSTSSGRSARAAGMIASPMRPPASPTVSPEKRPEPQLRKWLLAGLVAWAAAGLLVELNRVLTAYDQRGTRRDLPGLWRPGTRAPSRLAACLEAVDRRIAPGAVVSILSRPDLGEAEFFT